MHTSKDYFKTMDLICLIDGFLVFRLPGERRRKAASRLFGSLLDILRPGGRDVI